MGGPRRAAKKPKTPTARGAKKLVAPTPTARGAKRPAATTPKLRGAKRPAATTPKLRGAKRPAATTRASAATKAPVATTPADDALDFTLALGSAAHEIKNGLGPLAMTLQLAERKLLAGEAVPPQDLSFARDQVRRLSLLVNDLLDVTHLDTDHFPLRPRAGDLAATVSDAVDVFRRGNVRQIARAFPAAPLPATFDAERVLQVVLNLLGNAAKYAPLPAPITVAVTRSAGGARVEVRDGGPGVPIDAQGRLFERFVRARTEGDGTRGLGLGLYLCRAIVERHGGRIGVDSAPGKGATFWFELPLD